MIHNLLNKTKSSIDVIPYKIHHALRLAIAYMTDFTHTYDTYAINQILWMIHLDLIPRGRYETLKFSSKLKYRFKTFSCLYLDINCCYHQILYKHNIAVDKKLSDSYVYNHFVMSPERIHISYYVAFYINNHLKHCRRLHKKLCRY